MNARSIAEGIKNNKRTAAKVSQEVRFASREIKFLPTLLKLIFLGTNKYLRSEKNKKLSLNSKFFCRKKRFTSKEIYFFLTGCTILLCFVQYYCNRFHITSFFCKQKNQSNKKTSILYSFFHIVSPIKNG